MDLTLGIIPFEVDSDVSTSRPVCGDFVVFFEHLFEMLGVFATDVFDSEVVDDQCELNGSGHVFPEAWDQFALIIAVLVQTLFEEFIGK
jgi:hypothetical protein